MNIYERIYSKLQPILDALGDKDYVSLSSEGYMDLHVDRCQHKSNSHRQVIAIAHNYIQNGDVVPDPDMEIAIYYDRKMAEALTFQNVYIYQEVYFENDGKTFVYPKLKRQLNDFLNQWLDNLKLQGFFNPKPELIPVVEKYSEPVQLALL